MGHCTGVGLILGPAQWVTKSGIVTAGMGCSRHRSHLWLRFNHWPWKFHMLSGRQKERDKDVKEYKRYGVPLWHSRLRIQHCHCSNSGHCCGMGLLPGMETSPCHGCGQKKSEFPSWLMETKPTSIHEDAGSIPGLAQWVKDLASP